MKVKRPIEVFGKYFWSRVEVRCASRGFVLISCILIMSVLIVFSAAVMQLSRVESSEIKQLSAQWEAEDNARLALQMAIAQLQESTGPDQVVTARAEILSENSIVENRNWVGVCHH